MISARFCVAESPIDRSHRLDARRVDTSALCGVVIIEVILTS
jgi:hypothetical protein